MTEKRKEQMTLEQHHALAKTCTDDRIPSIVMVLGDIAQRAITCGTYTADVSIKSKKWTNSDNRRRENKYQPEEHRRGCQES